MLWNSTIYRQHSAIDRERVAAREAHDMPQWHCEYLFKRIYGRCLIYNDILLNVVNAANTSATPKLSAVGNVPATIVVDAHYTLVLSLSLLPLMRRAWWCACWHILCKFLFAVKRIGCATWQHGAGEGIRTLHTPFHCSTPFHSSLTTFRVDKILSGA